MDKGCLRIDTLDSQVKYRPVAVVPSASLSKLGYGRISERAGSKHVTRSFAVDGMGLEP